MKRNCKIFFFIKQLYYNSWYTKNEWSFGWTFILLQIICSITSVLCWTEGLNRVLIDYGYYSLLHKTDNDPYDILRFIIYTLYNIVSFLQFLNWIIDKNNATTGKYFRCLFKVNREVNASFVIGLKYRPLYYFPTIQLIWYHFVKFVFIAALIIISYTKYL